MQRFSSFSTLKHYCGLSFERIESAPPAFERSCPWSQLSLQCFHVFLWQVPSANFLLCNGQKLYKGAGNSWSMLEFMCIFTKSEMMKFGLHHLVGWAGGMLYECTQRTERAMWNILLRSSLISTKLITNYLNFKLIYGSLRLFWWWSLLHCILDSKA